MMEARDSLSDAGMQIHYNAGFIVLSYLVSLIGCVTTLELLHRRTSRRGAYNWYLLVTSCITLGGIGIWCMHFIGNEAVILSQGQPDRQVVYNPSWTALSFFLPIVVLLAAFYFLGVTDNANRYSIAISGVLTGMAVCGMHYLGQLGISNYSCSYMAGNVAGAGLIAVAASLLAFIVFFRLRVTWTDNWFKRSLCGAILACAISGMHWTASVGTTYRYKENSATVSVRSRTQTVIVCTVLSVLACAVLLSFALITNKKKKQSRKHAQQLMLACAYFDDHGRAMVTSEGTFPCQKITDHYVEKTFGEDELSRSHPTFVWVFKASRNWNALKDLVPGMKDHLVSDPNARTYYPGANTPPIDDASVTSTDFSSVFKQLFCIAAQNLATHLHESLDNLGVLFEEPLATGTVVRKHQLATLLQSQRSEEASTSSYMIGKGQYLFLVRQLSKSEVAKFAAQGYRFGTIAQVSEPLSQSMQISHDAMLRWLERMKILSAHDNLMPPGIHLVCFMLRPSIHKSFDVLVPAKTQNQLPLVTLPVTELATWQVNLLQQFDEWTMGWMMKVLVNKSGSPKLEEGFRWQLYRAVNELTEMVGSSSAMPQAVFSSRQILAPCRDHGTCTLLTFRLMNTIHAQPPHQEMAYVPLSFFSAQQQCDTHPASLENFARQAQLEFGHVLARGAYEQHDSRQSSRRPSIKDMRIRDLRRHSTPRKSHDSKPPSQSALISPHSNAGGVAAGEYEADDTSSLDNPRPDEEEGSIGLAVHAPSSPQPSSTPVHSIRGREEVEIRSRRDKVGGATATGTATATFVNECFALFRL